MSEESSKLFLTKQLRQLSKNSDFSIGLIDENIFEWRVVIEGPPGTSYAGGFFPAQLSFPKDFPHSPPKMRFLTKQFLHPNVYEDGTVCISILHEPVHDQFNEQEQMSEKWRPVIGIEAILVSVISMLADPNFSSPANIDASVLLRNKPDEYNKKIRLLVRRSNEDLANGL